MNMRALCHAILLANTAAMVFCFMQTSQFYVNLDTDGAVYFCTQGSACRAPVGLVRCKGYFCPRSRYVYCKWRSGVWDCIADLELGLKIDKPNITCTVPYGNWIDVRTCVLQYDVAIDNRYNYWERKLVDLTPEMFGFIYSGMTVFQLLFVISGAFDWNKINKAR